MKKHRRFSPKELHSVPVLPTMLTLGNLGCGFASIVLTSDGKFAQAAWMLFLGMIFDVFDGKVARLTNQTGKFGEEMDSLADIVSFGIAPAFLMQTYLWPDNLRKIGWIIALLYVFCAALRLARYNVESAPKTTYFFYGLPTPAAAGALASLILIDIEYSQLTWLKPMMPLFFVVLGVVMVSRVRYAHLANSLLGGRKSFSFLIQLLLVIVLLILKTEASLAIMCNGYALMGLVTTSYALIFKKKSDSLPCPSSSENPDGPSSHADHSN